MTAFRSGKRKPGVLALDIPATITSRVSSNPAKWDEELVRWPRKGIFYSEWKDQDGNEIGDQANQINGRKSGAPPAWAWSDKAIDKLIKEIVYPDAGGRSTNNWWGSNGAPVLSWYWSPSDSSIWGLPRYGIDYQDKPFLFKGKNLLHDDVPDGGPIGAAYLDGTLIVATTDGFYFRESGSWLAATGSTTIFDDMDTGLYGLCAPILFSQDGTKAVTTFIAIYGDDAWTRFRGEFSFEKDAETGAISFSEVRDDIDLSAAQERSFAGSIDVDGSSDTKVCSGHSLVYSPATTRTITNTGSTGTTSAIVIAGDYCENDLVDIELELSYALSQNTDDASTGNTGCKLPTCNYQPYYPYVVYSGSSEAFSSEAEVLALNLKIEDVTFASMELMNKATGETVSCSAALGDPDPLCGVPEKIDTQDTNNTEDVTRLIITTLDARALCIAGIRVNNQWERDRPSGAPLAQTGSYSVKIAIVTDELSDELDIGGGSLDDSEYSPADTPNCNVFVSTTDSSTPTGSEVLWSDGALSLGNVRVLDNPSSQNTKNADVMLGLAEKDIAIIKAAAQYTHFPSNPYSLLGHTIYSAFDGAFADLSSTLSKNTTGMGVDLMTADEFDSVTRPQPYNFLLIKTPQALVA